MFLARFLAFMAVFLAGWQGFWQLGRDYGSGFITGWRKPPGLFHSAKNRKESAKNIAFWQRDRYFWHFGAGFWQTTDVRIVRKPINRAFVEVSVECQKF